MSVIGGVGWKNIINKRTSNRQVRLLLKDFSYPNQETQKSMLIFSRELLKSFTSIQKSVII